MRRRALLSSVPMAGSLALAGCLDSARSAIGLHPDVTTVDVGDDSPNYLSLFEGLGSERAADADPIEQVAVGSSDDGHWAVVAAESGDSVQTTITVRPAGGDPLYETTVRLSNARYFGVKFQFVQDYELVVESDRHRAVTEIAADWVDCNASTHAVLLATAGSVESTYMTTAVEC